MSRDDILARLEELERDHRRGLALIGELREAVASLPADPDAPTRRECPDCSVPLLRGVSVDDHRVNVHGRAA